MQLAPNKPLSNILTLYLRTRFFVFGVISFQKNMLERNHLFLIILNLLKVIHYFVKKFCNNLDLLLSKLILILRFIFNFRYGIILSI